MDLTRVCRFGGYLGWLLLTFTAAGLGGLASVNARTFYAELVRPAWAPPGKVFGPVWGVLYMMIALAACLVWKDHRWAGAQRTWGLFIAQLAANALWSWLFFGWHQGALAFADVLLLWFLIAATVVEFWKLNRAAAVLLLPYLAWVTFASALCYATWRLNPNLL